MGGFRHCTVQKERIRANEREAKDVSYSYFLFLGVVDLCECMCIVQNTIVFLQKIHRLPVTHLPTYADYSEPHSNNFSDFLSRHFKGLYLPLWANPYLNVLTEPVFSHYRFSYLEKFFLKIM